MANIRKAINKDLEEMKQAVNDLMSFKDWATDRSRPSYGNQPQMETLSENFWGAGQRSLFIKQLEDRDFKNHEIRYIRTRARPDNDEIVEKMLS